MKKLLAIFSLIFGVFFTSCSNVVTRLDVESINIGKSKLIKIEKIQPYMNSLFVKITNDSDSVVEIVWDRSKINGAVPFLKGKYIDAGKSQPNDIIAPRDTTTFDIHSASKVEYVRGYGWYVGSLDYPVKLILCIKNANNEEFIISEIKGKIIEEEKK